MVGYFTGYLCCSNSSYNEKPGIFGQYRCIEYDYDGEKTALPTMDILEILTPISFNPPIHIFPINDELPEVISNEICSSSSVLTTPW
jgi:hypothetical protein